MTLVLASLFLGVVGHAAPKPEAEATKAAQTWLALIDDGKYGESWDAAAKVFQGAITREQWAATVANVRGPLGKLGTRGVKSAELRTSLPGAPDGKYVVVQFKTSFAKKKSAIETVTPYLEDGAWKVSGYFIK
jgi:predicted SnoaL-like aldol condensation-catalyzing enzyme